MIDKYLKYKAMLSRKSDVYSDFGNSDYEEEVEIPVFYYDKDKIQIEASGVTKIISRVYLTNVCVKPGDKLDGQLVKNVSSIPNFSGSIEYWEVNMSES